MKKSKVVVCMMILSILLSSMNFAMFRNTALAESELQSFSASYEVANATDLSSVAMVSVNKAKTRSEVELALSTLNPMGWSELSGTSKRENVPDVVLALRPEGGFTEINDFMSAVVKGMTMGRTNDFNYYDNPLEDYIRYYNLINPLNFSSLNDNQKLACVSLMKYFCGIGSDGYPIEFDYDEPLDFVDTLIGVITSVTSAQVKKPSLETNGKLNVGTNITMKNVINPLDGEKIIYISNNSNIAGMDLYTGYIAPKVFGTATLGYITYNPETSTILAYGIIEGDVDDKIPPTSEVYQPESGELNKLLVLFNEDMHQETRDITNVGNIIDSIIITGGNSQGVVKINDKANSVEWLTNRIVKISIPFVELVKGNIITVNYKSTVKDLGGNQALPTISPETIKDEISPIGKIITPKTGSISSIKVLFNERMSLDSKNITNIQKLLKSVKIMKGMNHIKDITIKSTPNSVEWIEVDGTDGVNITIPDTVLEEGKYITIEYTDIVKDKAGNIINFNPTIIPIGGALELDNDSVYDAIRVNAGGKTPIVAIVGSSRESVAAALESYNDLTSAQGAYAFIKHGFEPVFVPIAVDNYQTSAYSQENINIMDKALVVYYQGGDQFKHARSFLKDDGSDTPLMVAMRSIYSSGGVITGSSAGDHILSDPMFGNGTSYGDLSNNGAIFNSVADSVIGDEDNDRSGIMKGFGFAAPYAITDSHFDARGRLGRLVVVMRDTNQDIGIGLDENAAIVLKKNMGTVLGDNGVFIVDGSNAIYSERFDVDSQAKFSAKGLKVSYLSHEDIYDFDTKAVVSAKKPIENPTGSTYYSEDIFRKYENTKLIKSLVDSSDKYAYGITGEETQVFQLVYSKGEDSLAYKTSDMYTIDKLNLDIIPNPTKKIEDKIKLNDIDKHWSKEFIENLVGLEIISGTENKDGTYSFKPNESITRGEFAKIITLALGLEIEDKFELPFKDADKIENWAKPYVAAAHKAGIVEGIKMENGDIYFNSGNNIKRSEIAMMVGRILKVTENSTPSFEDLKDIPIEAYGSIKALADKKIMVGYSHSIFAPNENVTRGEVAKIITLILKELGI